MNLNLIVPTCWQELTPTQLRYVYFLIAQGFSQTAVQTHCLCRWSGLEILSPEGDGYSVRHDYHVHHINATQLAEVLSHMSWLNRLPIVPLRLPEIQGCQAVAADLQGLSFESYLVLENLYQGYLIKQDGKLLDEATPILYGKALELLPEEQISIFYWLSTVKQYYARRWKHFFVNSDTSSQPQDIQEHLQHQMDTQIRALTKGDITKEREVLSMDVHRALTELDAQAREYEELKRQTSNSAAL